MRTFVLDTVSGSTLRALNYSPAVERIRLRGARSARQLRTLVKEFGPAYGSVFTRLDCHPDYGVELITQGDMFTAEPAGRVIRLDSMPYPERHRVTRNQVLISGAGTLGDNELYGRSILADGRLVGKYVGPDSMSLWFEDPNNDLSLFTYAWLASPTGVQAIRSTSYGTKILRLRNDLLSSLPIPNASTSIVRRVASLVRLCSERREAFLREMRLARKVIEKAPEMQEAHAMCGHRQRRSIVTSGPFESLCAWNAASTGGALQYLRAKWGTTLGDIVEEGGIFNGPRFARIDCSEPHGIDFLSQRDVFMIRPVGRRIALPDVARRLLFVPRDALLVGSHGQMNEGSIFGRVELASFAACRSGVTQDILRVLTRDGYREVAYAFLSTPVGQSLLKSTAVGTSIPSMRVDLLKQLPFPSPAAAPLKEIRRHVSQAEAARIEADQAEAEAIRIIKVEVLPEWLA